jgi:hypothetical protein
MDMRINTHEVVISPRYHAGDENKARYHRDIVVGDGVISSRNTGRGP